VAVRVARQMLGEELARETRVHNEASLHISIRADAIGGLAPQGLRRTRVTTRTSQGRPKTIGRGDTDVLRVLLSIRSIVTRKLREAFPNLTGLGRERTERLVQLDVFLAASGQACTEDC